MIQKVKQTGINSVLLELANSQTANLPPIIPVFGGKQHLLIQMPLRWRTPIPRKLLDGPDHQSLKMHQAFGDLRESPTWPLLKDHLEIAGCLPQQQLWLSSQNKFAASLRTRNTRNQVSSVLVSITWVSRNGQSLMTTSQLKKAKTQDTWALESRNQSTHENQLMELGGYQSWRKLMPSSPQPTQTWMVAQFFKVWEIYLTCQ